MEGYLISINKFQACPPPWPAKTRPNKSPMISLNNFRRVSKFIITCTAFSSKWEYSPTENGTWIKCIAMFATEYLFQASHCCYYSLLSWNNKQSSDCCVMKIWCHTDLMERRHHYDYCCCSSDKICVLHHT